MLTAELEPISKPSDRRSPPAMWLYDRKRAYPTDLTGIDREIGRPGGPIGVSALHIDHQACYRAHAPAAARGARHPALWRMSVGIRHSSQAHLRCRYSSHLEINCLSLHENYSDDPRLIELEAHNFMISRLNPIFLQGPLNFGSISRQLLDV